MKKVLSSIFLLVGIYCFSQTATKKYNSMNRRYEYFDSRGAMIGYEFYNNMTRQWEYYEVNSQSKPYKYSDPQKLDISGLGNAATTLQNRYNNNQQNARTVIDDIFRQIKAMDISDERKYKIINRFNGILANNTSAINSGQTDWLYEVANIVVKESATD